MGITELAYRKTCAAHPCWAHPRESVDQSPCFWSCEESLLANVVLCQKATASRVARDQREEYEAFDSGATHDWDERRRKRGASRRRELRVDQLE